MSINKILAYSSGIIAVVSLALAVAGRLFFAGKAVFGMSALSYLRVANTMLLFTVVFLLFKYTRKKDA